MKAVILLIVIALVIVGCFAVSPNLFFVECQGVKAQGDISIRKKEIRSVQISLNEINKTQLKDIWVEVVPNTKLLLYDITEDVIKKYGVVSTKYFSDDPNPSYLVSGYSFHFKAGKLREIEATRYGYFPGNKKTSFAKFGSHKSNGSFSLPCTIEGFEGVFGKAEKITQAFSW